MDKSTKREIKRIRQVLHQIAAIAEEEEMEGGLGNAVQRYNAIVRHLETASVLPPGLFQLLNEEKGAVSFDQVGVESRMLSGYLEEVIDEEEEESASGRPDFGPVIALAPFLDQTDLKALIHSHLSGRGFTEPQASRDAEGGPPTLKSLVSLAPHMDEKDLAELVEACLARDPVIDSKAITALAPHMNGHDLGRILRKHLPNWFASSRQGAAPPTPPAAPTAPEAPAPPASPAAPQSGWQDTPRPETFDR